MKPAFVNVSFWPKAGVDDNQLPTNTSEGCLPPATPRRAALSAVMIKKEGCPAWSSSSTLFRTNCTLFRVEFHCGGSLVGPPGSGGFQSDVQRGSLLLEPIYDSGQLAGVVRVDLRLMTGA